MLSNNPKSKRYIFLVITIVLASQEKKSDKVAKGQSSEKISKKN
jgi:hypothetical protein